MRGQTEVREVINSSLVVNAVYSVSLSHTVDMDTVSGSISSNSTFSKLPTVNNENTRKAYENCTPFGPQFTPVNVNSACTLTIQMGLTFHEVTLYTYSSQSCWLLNNVSPNSCALHCNSNFTASLLPSSSGTYFQPRTEFMGTAATSGTGTHYQPTTEYTDTTATSGAGTLAHSYN